MYIACFFTWESASEKYVQLYMCNFRASSCDIKGHIVVFAAKRMDCFPDGSLSGHILCFGSRGHICR